MVWAKGECGNPKGRPKNARQRLTESFLKALIADFNKHKRELLPAARIADPAGYLRVIASILPKNVKIDPSDGGALFQIIVDAKEPEQIASVPQVIEGEVIDVTPEPESLVKSDT